MESRLGLFANSIQTISTSSNSIAAKTEQFLRQLKQKGMLMAGYMDKYEGFGYGSTEDDEKLFASVKGISIKFDETTLSEQEFDGVTEVIKCVMQKGESLNLPMMRDELSIMSHVSLPHKFSLYAENRDTFNRKNLPAPISRVPYDALITGVSRLMTKLFDSWTQHPTDTTLMQRSYNSYLDYTVLMDLEKIGKYLDKNFRFNFEVDENTKTVKVKADVLMRAKELLTSDTPVIQQAPRP